MRVLETIGLYQLRLYRQAMSLWGVPDGWTRQALRVTCGSCSEDVVDHFMYTHQWKRSFRGYSQFIYLASYVIYHANTDPWELLDCERTDQRVPPSARARIAARRLPASGRVDERAMIQRARKGI